MASISGEYMGNLKTKMIHIDSGEMIITEAPKDNGGDGTKFSPTDLVVTALGSCIMTIFGLVAKRDNINIEKMRIEAEKEMNSSSPRRIKNINLKIYLPKSLSEKERIKLERSASSCPVLLSLNPEIEVTKRYYYET